MPDQRGNTRGEDSCRLGYLVNEGTIGGRWSAAHGDVLTSWMFMLRSTNVHI